MSTSAAIAVGMTQILGSFGTTLVKTTVHYTRKGKTMSSILYVAYCLDCDEQLYEGEVKKHNCHEGKDNG